ncbi:MAG: hypothetical protein H0A75_06185 [Candidatus Methanofishera endochildressiae]|uniref:Uncharacterized protein n=1 Tax=Candidatus Methanofishera endochildressiae TaxID=2738884 RepID=A0A7Z0SD45_9GAMM|nr:hypothetical protein [Candidatus Methanofishera endochildressiae]
MVEGQPRTRLGAVIFSDDRSVESGLQIILGLGVSRGDRMDFSVQKSDVRVFSYSLKRAFAFVKSRKRPEQSAALAEKIASVPARTERTQRGAGS